MSNKPYSVTRQLTLVIILGAALVLSASSILLDVITGMEIQKYFDNGLLDKARALETLTEIDEGQIDFEYVDKVMPEYEHKKNPDYFELWVDGETVLERSASLGELDLPKTGLQQPGQHRFDDLILPDGRVGRLVEITFVPQIDAESNPDLDKYQNGTLALPVVTMVVARERVNLDNRIMTNRATIITTMSAVLVLIAILVSKYVKDGFAPVNRLAHQVKNIDENQLEKGISSEGLQSIELAPIEQQINHLLLRLETAFTKERRFSSDVAHELRTPVAELKSLAEVGRMHPENRDTVVAFFDDVKDISQQMELMLTNLLALARLDEEPASINAVRFLLNDLVNSVILRIQDGHKHNKFFENNVARDVVIHADKDKLEMMLKNLFQNALSYSPEGAIVRINSEDYQKGIRLSVSNPTSNLEQQDIPHMKERFWRKDQARSDSKHSGLGLSLANELAKAMGLGMELNLESHGNFTVSLLTLRTIT